MVFFRVCEATSIISCITLTKSLKKLNNLDQERFLKASLREEEIRKVMEDFKGHKVSIWSGEDGAGKSTFIGELGRYLQLGGKEVLLLCNAELNDVGKLKDIADHLRHLLQDGEEVFILVDSLDYLWTGQDNADPAEIKPKTDILTYLIILIPNENNLQLVCTIHSMILARAKARGLFLSVCFAGLYTF